MRYNNKPLICMRLVGHHHVPANKNLKNYPYRVELFHLLKSEVECEVYMIGDNIYYPSVHAYDKSQPVVNAPVYGDVIIDNMSYADMVRYIQECATWVAIDSFWHHASALQQKRGVAILGPWKKENVGYPWNINIEMPSEYQIPHCRYIDTELARPAELFPTPRQVVDAVKSILEERNV